MGQTASLPASPPEPFGQSPDPEPALGTLAADLLALIDADGRIRSPNPAWQATIGRPVAGEQWIDLVHPEDRPAVTAITDGLVCRMVHADGGERVVRWRLADGHGGVLAAGHDMTDLLRAQAEVQEFAYAASHDLAEPLRMVTSYLELLQRRYGGRLDDTADVFIGFAVEGAGRMQDLIDALLSLSRVGTHDLQVSALDLGAVVARVLAAHERAIAAARAEVTVGGPLAPAAGDPTLVGRLVSELVGNALKFRSPDRRARIDITAVGDGDGVCITVADNGIGIAASQRERVFNAFARLHGRDEFPGPGIGLTVCRRIVERHGGRIDVGPEPEGGSRFRVWLPR